MELDIEHTLHGIDIETRWSSTFHIVGKAYDSRRVNIAVLIRKRFASIAKLARDVLAIQASSVVSESCFSEASALVDAARSRLSDESIEASISDKSSRND